LPEALAPVATELLVTYRLQGIFSVIADPHRRDMLDFLAMGDRTAGEIAEKFSISRPAVANHIRILEENNLVTIAKKGRTRVHKLNAKPLMEVRDWIESYGRFWDDKLHGLKTLVEADVKRRKN
jgi:DNA-binding transcriptional ArsR family regulator